MKKILFLVLSLILLNCSSNDDSNNSIDFDPNKTFLENFDETEWKRYNSNNEDYIKITNNFNYPVEFYLKDVNCYRTWPDCFGGPFLAENETLSLDIIEDLGNIFRFRTIIENLETNYTYTTNYTLTITDDELLLQWTRNIGSYIGHRRFDKVNTEIDY